MSTTIEYNGQTTEIEAGETATMTCANQRMVDNVVITSIDEGGIAAQADYAENNPNNASYIKNRPFYENAISYSTDGYREITSPEDLYKIDWTYSIDLGFYYGYETDIYRAQKLSSSTYTPNQLIGAQIEGVHAYRSSATQAFQYDGTIYYGNIDEQTLCVIEENGFYYGIRGTGNDGTTLSFIIAVAYNNNYIPFSNTNVALPEPGLYAILNGYWPGSWDNRTKYGILSKLSFSYQDIKQIDNKFINLNIVVPDTNTSNRGTAGLVYMYNESSGLRLDDNKRICIAAATKTDVQQGTSHNKPIVPDIMKYAMQTNAFKDDISEVTNTGVDANTPAGAFAIKDFVLKNALNFKLHKIHRGETFEITPGMMALVLPYGDYTLSAHKSDGTTVANNMGATIVMATDWGADVDNANNYWVAFMYVKSATIMPTMSSNHNAYTANCYIKNNDSGTSGSGVAYVYYINRGE